MLSKKPVALITGASTGLGYALARVFAARGYDLVLVARDRGKLLSLKAELAPATRSLVLVADLAKTGATQKVFAAVKRKKISVGVLVNNAGVGSRGEFINLHATRELGQIDLNIRALTGLCHLFGHEMAKIGHGKILNVGSVGGYTPGPYMATYFATKSYVRSFSAALSIELKPRNVQVSVLNPGPVATEFRRNAGINTPPRLPSWIANEADARDVAKYAVDKFLKGSTVIIPGFRNRIAVCLMRVMPAALLIPITARAYRPKQEKRASE